MDSIVDEVVDLYFEGYGFNEIIAAVIPGKKCGRCKKSKLPTPEFYNKDKTQADGLQVYCKACRKIISHGEYIKKVKHQKQPEPVISKNTLKSLVFDEGRVYTVSIKERNKVIKEFEGELVSQTDNYITLKHHIHNYFTSFQKVDFIIGARKITAAALKGGV